MSDQGLTDMLATDGGPSPERRDEAAHVDHKKHAVDSLRAAHASMMQGRFEDAHHHMQDYQEHSARCYNAPHKPEDDLSDLLIVGPHEQAKERRPPRNSGTD